MPQYFSTDLDDEPARDACLTFVGGMFSNAKARMLKDEQASLIVNCDVSITGELASRRGTVLLGGDVGSASSITGLGYYKTTSDQYEVAAINGGVYKLNGGVWTQLGAQSFGSGQVALIQGGVSGGAATVADDKLYVCGDPTDVYKWNGSTWTNVSGDVSGKAPRSVSILRWHAGRLVAAGASIKTRSTETAVPDAIYFSDLLDGATWGLTTYDTQLRVGGGDGSAIMNVVPWTDFRLATFKRNSVWVIDCDPQFTVDNFSIQLVNGSVGCVAKRTCVQVGNDVLFLSDDGVRSLQQVVGSDQQHELSIPLSFPIQDYIRRINPAAVSSACATFWNNLYLISVPLDSSTTNNYTFVFNTITSTWSGFWLGLPTSCFAVRKGITQSLMAGLHTDNTVIEFLDYVQEADVTNATFTDYNGVGVLPVVTTRSLTFGDNNATKKGLEYEAEWIGTSGTIGITLLMDEEVQLPSDLLQLTGGGFAIPFTLPFAISRAGIQRQPFDLMRRRTFKELQFQIVAAGAGKKVFRQVTVLAFPEAGNRFGPQVGMGGTQSGITS